MTWILADPVDGRVVTLPVNDTAGTIRDFTWMGIRKGGERWYALQIVEGVPIYRLSSYRPGPVDGQPLRLVPFEIPPTPGNWIPLGLTNDKKNLIISSRDSTASSVDQFSYHDMDGNLLKEVACSDSPDRNNKQIVYLEHNFYVVSRGGDGWSIKMYDRDAILLDQWIPTNISSGENIAGITTDGKCLYLLVISGSTRIEKYSTDGVFIRDYGAPGDGESYLAGITFSGRYLVARI